MNLDLFGREGLMGPYQNILVVKNTGSEEDKNNILYKGIFLSTPSHLNKLEMSYIRTNEDYPDTIILEVEYNES